MKIRTIFSIVLSGALFGAGLSLSTMIQPEVVLSFLRFVDFGLLLVLGGAVVVTFVAYAVAPRLMTKPLFAAAFLKHVSNLDSRTLIGAAIFGIGWGLCGVCPGPAIAGLGAGNWPLLWALAAMFLGAWTQGKYFGEGS
ncbi:MAG: DUF6691 family protein [Usitatibacteraceae bacterium]